MRLTFFRKAFRLSPNMKVQFLIFCASSAFVSVSAQEQASKLRRGLAGHELSMPPLVRPVTRCSSDEPCVQCQGHCNNDDDCVGGLVCARKDGRPQNEEEANVPGCDGTDFSRTQWCVDPATNPGQEVEDSEPSEERASFVPGVNQLAYQKHYLVGLLNYPNSYIPDILADHTSGTALGGAFGDPYDYIPSVGFSDIEPYFDENGSPKVGEFFCLSDNGYGSSANSIDYALNIVHMKIQKPFTFRHGESTFDKYTETENLGTALIHDPNGYIKWENGADIQVTYSIPDSTWDDYRDLRVLTGRDFDVEGMAVINNEFAIIGDELMPAIFAVNPTTGVVLTPFVRTPDIDGKGQFNGRFLSTRGDKVHCSLESLEADECPSVDSSIVDGSEYRKHDPSGGFEGFSVLADGTIVAFLEKTTGDTTLNNEPGVRVYHILPGDGTPENPPKFEKFLGFYPLEINAENIADASAIPGSSNKVLVIERNGFPRGNLWPGPLMPANKLCVVDLFDINEDMVMTNKKCILNYHDIDDPWDVDGNGIFKYAQSQVTNEQVIVVDDYCIVAGTDTNFPFTNDFQLEDEQVPFLQEVTDTRFMVVCFVEPIFNLDYGFL